jgi:hypothetical protein
MKALHPRAIGSATELKDDDITTSAAIPHS